MAEQLVGQPRHNRITDVVIKSTVGRHGRPNRTGFDEVHSCIKLILAQTSAKRIETNHQGGRENNGYVTDFQTGMSQIYNSHFAKRLKGDQEARPVNRKLWSLFR